MSGNGILTLVSIISTLLARLRSIYGRDKTQFMINLKLTNVTELSNISQEDFNDATLVLS